VSVVATAGAAGGALPGAAAQQLSAVVGMPSMQGT